MGENMNQPILPEGVGGVDIRLPPDIHEAAVNQFQIEEFDPQSQRRVRVKDSALDAMAAGLSFAREAAATVLKTHDAIMQDINRTPENRAKVSRETALKIAANVAAKMDRAKALAQSTLDELEARTALPPPPANELERDVVQACRMALRSMPADERAQVVQSMDLQTAQAILLSPPWLVGMFEAEHMMFGRSYRTKYHPKEADRCERLRKAIDAMDRSADHFLKFVDKMTDKHAVHLADAAEERARAQLAAAQAFQGGH